MTNSLEVLKKVCSKAGKECVGEKVIRFYVDDETDGSNEKYILRKSQIEINRKKKNDQIDKILQFENYLGSNLIKSSVAIPIKVQKEEKLYIGSDIYCEKSNVVVSVMTFNANLNTVEVSKKPAELKDIYNAEQMQILDSFNCPDAGFFKKKSKLKARN